MKKFEELDKRTPSAVETDILKEWEEKDILNLTIENRNGHPDFVFYDGPATANGMPKLHHMLAKFLNNPKTKCSKLWRSLFVVTIAVPQFVSLLVVRNFFANTGNTFVDC